MKFRCTSCQNTVSQPPSTGQCGQCSNFGTFTTIYEEGEQPAPPYRPAGSPPLELAPGAPRPGEGLPTELDDEEDDKRPMGRPPVE